MKRCPVCGTVFDEPIVFCSKDGSRLEEDEGPPSVESEKEAKPTEARHSQPTEVKVAAATRMAPGIVIGGRYRLSRLIGIGGMGDVYEAEDVKIEKRVAVKILRKEFAVRAEIVARFRREALSAARIGHENVIDVTDLDQTPDGHLYLVMEFLEGMSLSRLLQKGGRIPPRRTTHMLEQMAAGLDAAHAKKVVHRDLKPGNVFIIQRPDRPDFIKLLDFGIARVVDASESERLTRAGTVLGTPDYMSPEQAHGEDLDQRTDIYSAGVILLEMLTGRTPFQADTYMAMMAKHMMEEAPRLEKIAPELGLGVRFSDAIAKALSKKREDRFTTMAEFVGALKLAAPQAFDRRAGRGGATLVPRSKGGRTWIAGLVGGLVAVGAAAVVALLALGGGGSKAGGQEGLRTDAAVGPAAKWSPGGPLPPATRPAAPAAKADGGAPTAPGTKRPPRSPGKGDRPPLPPRPGGPAPANASVRFESKPSGAVVLEGARRVCITPCVGTFAAPEEKHVLSFVKAHYVTEEHVIIPLAVTTYDVSLKAERPGGAKPPPSTRPAIKSPFD